MTYESDKERHYQQRDYFMLVNESAQQDGANWQELSVAVEIINQGYSLGIIHPAPVPVNMRLLGYKRSRRWLKKYIDLLIVRGVLEEVPNGDLFKYRDIDGQPLNAPFGISKEDEKNWRSFIVHPVHAQVKKGLTHWANLEKERTEKERQRVIKRKSSKAGQAYYARKAANAKQRRLVKKATAESHSNVVDIADFIGDK